MIPHPGNPSISLWAFPQPFFIECSALLSPVPLFAKLAIPVKSLIKNAALSNQPASLLAAVHARPIRLPFPSLWLCCFLFCPFLCHLSFKFFHPAGFSCASVPVLASALHAAPAFFGLSPVFRAVGAARFSAFFPLFWLWFRFFCQNFASSLNNCGLHCRTPQKKAILSIINFKPFHFSRSETLWIPTIHPKKAAASG